MFRAALQFVAGVDTQPFKSGLEELRSRGNSFRRDTASMFAGAFTFGVAIAGFRALTAEMARTQDLADRFGEKASQVQKVAYAAEQSGADIELAGKAIQKATQNAAAARDGNLEMAKSFQRLGIDAATFVNLPMSEKLLAVAKGLEGIESSGDKLNSVVDVMGKGGGEVMPLLIQGSAELAQQLNEAVVAGDGVVRMFADLDDTIAKTSRELKVGFGTAIAVIVKGWGFMVQTATGAFTAVAKSGVDCYAAIGFALRGHFGEARKSLADIKTQWESFRTVGEGAKADFFGENDIGDRPRKTSSSGPTAEAGAAASAAEAEKKSVEDIARLRAEVAAAEEKARQKALSDEQQLAEMKLQRAVLESSNAKSQDSAVALQAQKEILELTEKISAAEAASQAAIDTGNQRRQDRSESRKVAKMSDEEQAGYFLGKSKELRQAADYREKRGDKVGAAKLRDRADEFLGRAGEANERIKSKKDQQESQKSGLRDDIAAQEKKQRYDALAPEQQLHELLKQRAALERAANNETVAGLQARKDLLDVDDSIAAKRKEIKDASAESESARQQQRAQQSEDRREKEKEIAQAAQEYRQRQLDLIYRSARVTASSLASVGGGGGIAQNGSAAMVAELRIANRWLAAQHALARQRAAGGYAAARRRPNLRGES